MPERAWVRDCAAQAEYAGIEQFGSVRTFDASFNEAGAVRPGKSHGPSAGPAPACRSAAGSGCHTLTTGPAVTAPRLAFIVSGNARLVQATLTNGRSDRSGANASARLAGESQPPALRRDHSCNRCPAEPFKGET